MQKMRDKKAVRNIEKNSKMIDVSPSLSVIVLNVNGLNSSVKRQ